MECEIKNVSIVTVCLNAYDTIETTLQSVKNQSFDFIEHILIDGGSVDGTIEIIEHYSTANFISEPDEGLYYAMQKGAQTATGDIVFFLNSGDVFFDKDVVTDVVRFFNMTGSDAVFGNLMPIYLQSGDTHDHRAFRDNKLLDLSYFNNRKLFFDESIHHQTLFYKREVFDYCSFICENPIANGEYHLNMCAFIGHGYSVKHVPRPICRFALGGKSTSNFAEEWKRFSSARDYLRRKFFPHGSDIQIQSNNEYLYYPPSFRNRVKIFLRKSSYYHYILTVKNAIFNLMFTLGMK